jgi:transposase
MLQSKIKHNHGDTMIGKQDRKQRHLFIAGDIDQFIPEDHILRSVDRMLDLSWLQKDL